MATNIRHKRSSVPGKKPTTGQLQSGELAVNTADGKVFLLKDDNTVQDITQRIFENDSQIIVNDQNDGTPTISVEIDSNEKIKVTNTAIELKENVDVDNAKTLTFKELDASGNDGISIKAPDTMESSYTLTLPSAIGAKGNLLTLGESGNLEFLEADIYGGNTVYVSAMNGNDLNDGLNLPVKTVKRACQIASGLVYNVNGTINGTRVTVKVAVGDYTENNPIIVPDNVVIKGESLRGCLIRPNNANLDMLRVRNASYFAEFTFRDKVDTNFVPTSTWDYAVSFDDPDDAVTDRTGYINLPDTKPTITSSPYIQNCSIISFLGGNGVKVDGSKVNSPNVSLIQLESENPVSGPAPEQGKSMVANAFTMLSFGGTGWRLSNDAYSQIVSCFQIFMLNGVYTQSGGYVSITNSATNFGLYALRSSGYSPKTFAFDRSFVTGTGVSRGRQTISIIGINRNEPVNEFVVRFRNPEYKIAFDLIESEKNTIADDTLDWIDAQIAGAGSGSIWENFAYSRSVYRSLFLIILDSVAQDTWSTGNALTRQTALNFYSSRLADSSNSTISGQEQQLFEAIEQASVYTGTVISSLDSAVITFVDSKFDLIKNAIVDPLDIPDAVDVTSQGDITNDYKAPIDTLEFNGTADVTPINNIFTITDHGFVNLQKIVYSSNGNIEIPGLNNEQTYYVKLINTDEFTLSFDESGDFAVDIRGTSSGTHQFLSNIREFFVQEILSSHQTYQKLILESGAESYNFVPGRAITATTGALNNSAFVYSWKPADRELVVSVEEVTVGTDLQRNQFTESSIITSDHSLSPNTDIGVNETANVTNLGTSTFSISSTVDGGTLTNLGNLLEKQCWFHRPSIVNSSAHTWEYAGSGIDYNALPQNGGNTRVEFEQFAELPGRVYSSGTNELGDFKVGDFITAFNRTGNITFKNKVSVDELDAIRLTLSDIVIEEISTNVNLGDDELGGPKDTRLSTQLAIRSFLSNRLGFFIDKSASTSAVPGAIVQLNSNGQLNSELIPATRQFTNTSTVGYESRLLQVDEIPAVDLKAGDIATEEFEQIEITLDSAVSANDGDIISIDGNEAYIKGSYVSSLSLIIASVGATFTVTPDSTFFSGGTVFINGVDTGASVIDFQQVSEIITNYFLKESNTSQFLVLDNSVDYVFTSANIASVSRTSNIQTINTDGNHDLEIDNSVQIVCTSDSTFSVNGRVLSTPSATSFTIAKSGDNVSNTSATGTVRSIISSADGGAQGAVTETRYGVLTSVNNANLTGGTNYTPTSGTLVYENVPLTSITGTGTGARADITVINGAVTDVDLRRGGTGYNIGDTIGVAAIELGEDELGSGFQITADAIEKRAYVNIIGGELFVASSSSLDFAEDNSAVTDADTITLTDTISNNFLAGDSGAGGAVDYSQSRITINTHGLTTGDPVTYNTLGNIAIGGLLNNNVYYVKVIDVNTIELYSDYDIDTQIIFTSTPANNNHNITRYSVNIIDNSIIVPNHGYLSGDAVRINGDDLFDINETTVVSGSRFFVGSITTNSFTIHTLRSEALLSANGLAISTLDITAVGTGSAKFTKQNVKIQNTINTSSRISSNWNNLAATNIDASNIISGTISPSRLASSGVANTDTFLRGDSSYQVVVQTLKKATTTDNPISIIGSNVGGEFYGTSVTVGIDNVDYSPLDTYSTLGVSRFLQSQFEVDDAGTGQVFIKDGVIDAGTLDSLDSSYFLNPTNLTSAVPVNRGGTALTSYIQGDIIYASTSGVLDKLPIGRENAILTSTGSIPSWKNSLHVVESVDINTALLNTSSTGIGQLFNNNVTSLELGSNAENIKLGRSTANRDITSLASSYDAASSQFVTVNLGSFTKTTNAETASGSNEIRLSNTSNIVYGMLVIGSASIPSNSTVIGVSDTHIYISNNTTGTISSATSLTLRYTPLSIGIREGDTVNIASSAITNLDGSWPVTGATENATSFEIKTANNVTANPLNAIAGTLTKDNTILIRNKNVIFGSAESSNAPVTATLKGESGIGNNINGADFVIQAGLGTGNASSNGSFIVKTGAIGSSGDLEQSATTRLTIDNSGKSTFAGIVEVQNTLEVDTANGITTNQTTFPLVNTTATTVNFAGAATTVEIGSASGTTNVNNNLVVDLDLAVNGGDLTTTATTFNLLNTTATTVNFAGAATTLTLGAGSGTTTINNDVSITGNLVVNGTTFTVNSTTVSIDDPIINLGGDTEPTVDDNKDRGITFRWHDGTNPKKGFFGFDDSSRSFTFIPEATVVSEVVSGDLGGMTLNSINLNNHSLTSTTETIGITSLTSSVVDEWDLSLYRTGKYILQVTCTAGSDINSYQTSEILVIHNGSVSTLTDYAVVKTGNNLVTFTTDISGGNLRLLAQATSGNTITVKLSRTILTV